MGGQSASPCAVWMSGVPDNGAHDVRSGQARRSALRRGTRPGGPAVGDGHRALGPHDRRLRAVQRLVGDRPGRALVLRVRLRGHLRGPHQLERDRCVPVLARVRPAGLAAQPPAVAAVRGGVDGDPDLGRLPADRAAPVLAGAHRGSPGDRGRQRVAAAHGGDRRGVSATLDLVAGAAHQDPARGRTALVRDPPGVAVARHRAGGDGSCGGRVVPCVPPGLARLDRPAPAPTPGRAGRGRRSRFRWSYEGPSAWR